ncbi:MAG: transposase [Thermoplasmatales archaeon]
MIMESFSENAAQAEICRRHGIYPVQLSKWMEQFIQGGKSALAQRRSSDSRDEEIEDLKKITGDQSLVIGAFKKCSGMEMIVLEDLKQEMSSVSQGYPEYHSPNIITGM